MKKMKNITAVILVIIFALFCMISAGSVKSAVSDALDRCLTVIIPSLYAMMIASGLLVKSSTAQSAGKIVCGLFSMLAGYPVGAKILYSQYAENSISKKEAELLSGVFFGAGGAFIFGCTSNCNFVGWLILLSNVLANIIIALAVLFCFRKNKISKNKKEKISFSVEMLMDSVNSAGKSMAEICFAVIVFAVVTAILKDFGILSAVSEILTKLSSLSPETAENIICAVLDITAVSRVAQENFNLVPVVSGLVSFGGICVFLQISTIFKGRLSVFPLIVFRSITAVLSYIICRILLPFFMEGKSIAVSAIGSRLHESDSPIPSILLIIMTVILFYEYEKNIKKFHKTLDK
ncbi:MAG: hypothetical protein K2H19_09610 [Ruminococcus sp.]|nr:hypothetical protein [Ruminococcus sp.]